MKFLNQKTSPIFLYYLFKIELKKVVGVLIVFTNTCDKVLVKKYINIIKKS